MADGQIIERTQIAPRSGADAAVGRTAPLGKAAAPSKAASSAQRSQREDDYRLFRLNAAAVFKGVKGDPGHERMAARCGFHVSMTDPEERAASAADSVVEVFYGPRTLPHLKETRSDAARAHWPAAVETGATLLYAQGADGVVTVFLYPAQTDRCLAAEDAILLGRYADVTPLTGRGTLEAHWRALRSYAETTSLDGEPTLLDRLAVRWLRFTRPRIVDNRRQPIAAATVALQIVGGGIAIALAAVLLGLR